MSDSAVESPPKVRMTRTEFRATAYLAGVSGLRMLGLFIVLPVLALYAASLPGGGDPAMIGFAIGVYGLAQAVHGNTVTPIPDATMWRIVSSEEPSKVFWIPALAGE